MCHECNDTNMTKKTSNEDDSQPFGGPTNNNTITNSLIDQNISSIDQVQTSSNSKNAMMQKKPNLLMAGSPSQSTLNDISQQSQTTSTPQDRLKFYEARYREIQALKTEQNIERLKRVETKLKEISETSEELTSSQDGSQGLKKRK